PFSLRLRLHYKGAAKLRVRLHFLPEGSVRLSIRKKAKIVFERAQTLCSDLNRSQKFFFFGALLGLIALLWRVTPFDKAFLSVAILSGLLLVSGVISDLLSIYARTFSTTLGKGVLLLLYSLATTTAYALATQIVNQV